MNELKDEMKMNPRLKTVATTGRLLRIGVCIASVVMLASVAVAGDGEVGAEGNDEQVVGAYGAGSGAGPTVSLADLLADPRAYDGKEIRVAGTISGVCPKKGCWMELRDPEDRRLRVKVTDGVIVFPIEAEGLQAAARGVVRIREMSRESYAAWLGHLAEEKGETFDDSSLGDGPFELVELAGSGADIGP